MLTALRRHPYVTAWAIMLCANSVLFLVWPYQHWYFSERLSLFAGWWRTIAENEEWIFCPLVPLLSGWLAWRKRATLREVPLRPSPLGIFFLAFALFCYWVGHRADTAYPGFAAFQLSVAALIVLLSGWGWMRILLFPWLFLTFMWPAFPLEDQLALPLRLFTAQVSTQLLNGVGIDTLREGTGLYSAADAARGLAEGALFKLDVDDPCSGIRSLYALMMLAALYGYVFLRGFWARLVLFASAVPLAIVGNLVRMVLLAAASLWFGMDFAVGRMVEGHMEISLFHELAGFAVFAVALAGMFGISSLLEGRQARKQGEHEQDLVTPDSTGDGSQGRLLFALISGLTLVGGTLALCSGVAEQPALSAPGVVSQLPLSIGAAQGLDIPITQREKEGLAADITLTRSQYLAAGKSPLLLSLVISGETRRGLHRPDVCLPGQGWNILDRQAVPAPLPAKPEHQAMMLRVFREIIHPDGSTARVRGINLFWYQGAGAVSTPHYYSHVFRTYFDSVFRNVNHRWALVSFFVQLPDSGLDGAGALAEASALEDLRDFIQQAAPNVLAPIGGS